MFVDIRADIKVPKKCNASCLLCDVDYSTFGGYCNLFSVKLDMQGTDSGGKWFKKCDACLEAEERYNREVK
jgi:hypothetical protein